MFNIEKGCWLELVCIGKFLSKLISKVSINDQ